MLLAQFHYSGKAFTPLPIPASNKAPTSQIMHRVSSCSSCRIINFKFKLVLAWLLPSHKHNNGEHFCNLGSEHNRSIPPLVVSLL